MRRVLGLAAVWLSLAGAVVALVIPDGDARVWWFRGFTVLVGVVAVRSLLRWVDAQPRPPSPEPFRRRRRSWHRRPHVPTHPTDQVLQLAMFSAGDAHRGLRPRLQEVAEERLRARYGVTLADPAARERLAPATWDLLRPDRPKPHDLRAPGLSPDTIDAVIADLEAL